jgi:mannose-6-phosphate isomerase-like protein (cupin superfamily)
VNYITYFFTEVVYDDYMKGYTDNIEQILSRDNNFRRVLYTSKFCQLVAMTLRPNEEIGEEIHDVDQFFRFETGNGKAVIDGIEHIIRDGFVVIVPAGAKHNIINTSGTEPLKLYTLYCPPHHDDGIVRTTKELASVEDEHFTGKTTE